MRKWRSTILLTTASAALAVTAHWWVPRLLPILGIVFKNKETVGTFKDFVQLVVGFVTLAVPFFKVRRDRKEKEESSKPTQAINSSSAGRDNNVAGGNIQTGGVSAQGNVSIGGDLFEGDKVQGNKTVIVHSPPLPPLTPRFQLPPPPADFTGREAELRDLHAAIEKGGVHISGLQGQGGVGKTALALKLAAELSPNYPDARIYLDLKGVSEKPLTAAEALSHVVRTFHPEVKLPEKEDDLCALFRSVLHDKRVLLLMDNAKDAAQVKSLIPPEGCTLLVTSRFRFTLPGLHQKSLDTFPPEDAKKLLLEIAPRIKGEAEAIAKLCGYLALALRLAATAIAEHIDLAPKEYREKLADEKQRLKLLGGAEAEGVNASITLSYNLLDAETQKRWRMLSVFPDTFDAPAAASVWELETDAAADEAKSTLSRLVQFSMLEWEEPTSRYRLHDLMRDFARQRLAPDESNSVARRHSAHYLAVLQVANDFYREGGQSMMRGLVLYDLELRNVQAGQAWAASNAARDSDAAKSCSHYAGCGSILGLRQHPREGIRWCEAALAAARAS